MGRNVLGRLHPDGVVISQGLASYHLAPDTVCKTTGGGGREACPEA